MARNETVSDVFDEEKQFPFEWVKKICGDNVSPFLISSELINKFNKLKYFHECTSQDEEKVRKILLELKDKSESETISYLAGINVSSLPSEVRSVLADVARFQMEVGCDGSATATQLARLQLGSALDHCQLQTKLAERNLRELEQIHSTLRDDCQALSRQISDNEKEEKTQKHSRKALKQEIKSLLAEKEACIKEFQLLSKDKDSLVDNAAVHSQAEVLLSSLEEERQEADALRSQLAKFGGLPPDLRGAKAMVKAEEEELKHLQGEIAFLVNNMGSDYSL